MAKVYKVHFEIETIVAAESPKEAEMIAERDIGEIVDDSGINNATVIKFDRNSPLPKGWEMDCIPFGNQGHLTIDEILDQNYD